MKNIIIIDMQKGFINKNNIHLVDKINNYLLNNKFDNVFYTKCVYSENSPFVKILNWTNMKDIKEQEIIVNLTKNAVIFDKEGYGLSNEDINKIKRNFGN